MLFFTKSTSTTYRQLSMKKTQFVLSTSLLSFMLPTLLKIGTEPIIQVSRPPEGFLGDNAMITFEAPSESIGTKLVAFLKRLQKTAPGSIHLL